MRLRVKRRMRMFAAIHRLARIARVGLRCLQDRIVAESDVRRFFPLLPKLDPGWGFAALLAGIFLLLSGLWFSEADVRVPEPPPLEGRPSEPRCWVAEISPSPAGVLFLSEFERTPFGKLGEVAMFSAEAVERAAVECETAEIVAHP